MVDRPEGNRPAATRTQGRTDGETRASPTEPALAERLTRLGESLEAHRSTDEGRPGVRATGFAQAVKVASEFVAGVVVGGALGWGIDRFLGTSPWALIVFLLLGFAAGVLNVLRAEGKVAEAGARLREAERSRPSATDLSDG